MQRKGRWKVGRGTHLLHINVPLFKEPAEGRRDVFWFSPSSAPLAYHAGAECTLLITVMAWPWSPSTSIPVNPLDMEEHAPLLTLLGCRDTTKAALLPPSLTCIVLSPIHQQAYACAPLQAHPQPPPQTQEPAHAQVCHIPLPTLTRPTSPLLHGAPPIAPTHPPT